MVTFDFPRVIRPASDHDLLSVSDGDTPNIRMPVRMVSVDTPEKATYAGGPPTAQATLDRCRQRLLDGTYDALPQGLRDYLVERITPDAAARHITAGDRATQEFDLMQQRRLTRPDGGRRKAAVIATGELIEQNGRLLAYMAPWFGGGVNDPLPPRDHPDRRTFNLDMVANGWAAMFLIYPSLPRNQDLQLLLDAAESAWTKQLGAWAEFGEDLQLAYEFRACVKLGRRTLDDPADAIAEAYQRVCVDLRTRREVGLYDYHQVPPPHRLWIWQNQLDQARQDLDLLP